MRVLITAGGTEEPVDSVRRLTNTSTGRTGGVLARHFAERGAEVLLLHAARAPLDDVPVERVTFVTFSDLAAALRRLLAGRRFDAVVHLAAVSDYAVAAVEVDGCSWNSRSRGKIGSGRDLVIRLRPNPKLIDSLREWSSNPEIRVVGFKLTDEPDAAAREAQVRDLLARSAADLVVHNDVSEIDGERHRAVVWSADGPLLAVDDTERLAAALYDLLVQGDSR